MAIEISLKKGTANPTSGLTLAEPLFNSTNNTFWMGKGTGNTPVWLGAGICGASGGIAAGLTYQIPTLGAVKDYFIGVSGSFLPSTTGFVSSFNGATGAVTGVSSFNGLTGAVSFVNYVASFNGNTGAVQGVSAAAAGTGISISAATGAITITNTGVQTFNGLTGAVTGVTVGGANTFTALNTFNAGISAAGGVTFAGTVSSDTGYRISSSAFNTQTGTTYTFIAADNGDIVMFNNASAITVTVPTGLPVGFNCTAIQLGAGQVGFTAASGVTLNSYSSATKIAGQHGAATIIGYSTNIYNLSGTLTI